MQVLVVLKYVQYYTVNKSQKYNYHNVMKKVVAIYSKPGLSDVYINF